MATGTEPVRRQAIWPLVVGVGLVVAIVVLGSAFVPRWWSHRVGNGVNESFTKGILLGLFLGFVFTLLPLALAWLSLRRIHSWRGRSLVLLVAAVLALPNLLTLSIVLGTGNAAHAGDRTLDVEAPGFRGASLAGALVAAAVILWPAYMLRSRRRGQASAPR